MLEKLTKQDYPPTIYIDGKKCWLVTIRNGYTELSPISNKVAQELIAMGLAYSS